MSSLPLCRLTVVRDEAQDDCVITNLEDEDKDGALLDSTVMGGQGV